MLTLDSKPFRYGLEEERQKWAWYRCHCGNEVMLPVQPILDGTVSSCGCEPQILPVSVQESLMFHIEAQKPPEKQKKILKNCATPNCHNSAMPHGLRCDRCYRDARKFPELSLNFLTCLRQGWLKCYICGDVATVIDHSHTVGCPIKNHACLKCTRGFACNACNVTILMYLDRWFPDETDFEREVNKERERLDFWKYPFNLEDFRNDMRLAAKK